MYQFYTTEVKKSQSGQFEHEVLWHWDEDKKKAQLKGEAKFHEILSRAAVSDYAEHSAILFASTGNRIMDKCYYHTAVPADVGEEVIPDA